MIAIIDYGVGNLFSLSSSLKYLGIETTITNKAEDLTQAEKIILPGVGAFADAKRKLDESGLVPCIKEQAAAGKPFLGICVGMQLMLEKSYEYGEHEGLGLIKGEICPIELDLSQPLKVPQIGWNSLQIKKNHPLLSNTKDGDYVYYVHSYYAKNCEASTVAVSDYDVEIPGVVAARNVMGTQFHPEKSGDVGLEILRAFSNLTAADLV